MTEKQRGLEICGKEELLSVAHDTVAVAGVREARFCYLFSLNPCMFSKPDCHYFNLESDFCYFQPCNLEVPGVTYYGINLIAPFLLRYQNKWEKQELFMKDPH